ncbi:tyrosine-type recombinase/integrase [Massilia sp. DWR3-1-1]|uniref:tyrosine-type recombinase/integrase n=1 Tax=Massilia sp. DWR3-1-1 TaxID=2804559 RepID=UPI003CF5C98A
MNRYFIRMLVRESGERLPVLCTRESGMPLFYPTCFALSHLRNSGQASATLEQALRSVMALQLILDRSRIDLFSRLNEGRILEQWEVEEAMRQASSPLRELAAVAISPVDLNATYVIYLPGPGEGAKPLGNSLHRRSLSVRLVYIRSYLNWIAELWIGRMRRAGSPELGRQLEAAQKRVSAQLGTRIPRSRSRTTLKQREGLSTKDKVRLLEVVRPESPDNPWTSHHGRARNRLVVELLLKLGCRRGELLGLRTADVNFATGVIRIVRKADDKNDPRPYEPNTKTSDREVMLGNELTSLLKSYVQVDRRSLKGARKHGFIFVANGSGAPLSLSGLAKVFAALRNECPDLPSELSPHVLRHTWNDDFSEHCDRENISNEEEAQLRNYAMGWAPDSLTSQVYLRRHTREQSKKVSLKMQGDLIRNAT